MSAYSQHIRGRTATPQNTPIIGREAEMVRNNAGGFGFILDNWERLTRFLIMGSEGGTYYVSQPKLTAQNAGAVIACIKEDGARVVREAHAINTDNRAPKVDQQLFAMALVLKHGDVAAKTMAELALKDMLRTGTHLLHFVEMLDGLGGWNRSKRRIVADWFEEKQPDDLAFQVLKYQRRDGWSMRDVLRMAHPKAISPELRAVYDWICGRDTTELMPSILRVFNALKSRTDPVAAALEGIALGLPREALPNEAVATKEVWSALLPKTPPHALLRNLGTLSSLDMFAPGEKAISFVAAQLTDVEKLRKARVHPFAVLLASLVYRRGEGVRGSKTWKVSKQVIEILDDAYELAFQAVQPTGKRLLIGIDVSGSMGQHNCIGMPIQATQAAAAIALTLGRLEPHADVVQFDTEVTHRLAITRRTGISSVAHTSGGLTDLTAPVRMALKNRTSYDAFIILTDNETWAGMRHPTEVFREYRDRVNIDAKLVCCSFAANHANIVDPMDPRQMGCAGLDANIPTLVADFIGR